MIKAILTGHSKGLGAALADELLRRDITVLGVSRSERRDLRGDRRLEQHSADLSDTRSLLHWLSGRTLRDFLQGADTALLINNAGLLQPIASLQHQQLDAIASAVSLNVTAALMLSAAFVQQCAAADRRILHVSSGAGRKAYAGWSIYCATKAAMDHHARCVALEKAPGLRISSIAPGVIDTNMQDEIRASPLDDFPDRPRFDAMHRDGVLQRPQDVAERVIGYLLSADYGAEPVADLGPPPQPPRTH